MRKVTLGSVLINPCSVLMPEARRRDTEIKRMSWEFYNEDPRRPGERRGVTPWHTC
jgi:hypothetical protein